jgi:hypothetical protein
MEALVILTALVALALAATRYGVDSRDGTAVRRPSTEQHS